MEIAIILTLAIIIIVLINYNSLIKLRNKVRQSESVIDVYLNQRFDLIPNLVECVKGYNKHEKELLENITKMRTAYNENKNLKKAQELNNNLNKLMLVAENYPDLKANEQFLNLQKNLTKMESQLQAARRIYNVDVTKYNTKIGVVPTNIIAKIFGFKEAELFKLEELKKENIDIKFGE